MKALSVILILSVHSAMLSAQPVADSTDYNLNFEKLAQNKKLPEKWMQWGTGYSLSVDTTQKFDGKSSLRIKSSDQKTDGSFGSAANTIPAVYEGKEIELRGYVKLDRVENGWAGLMLRVDGASGMLQFDNMQKENVSGTSDWKQYSVKLPYSRDAKKIHVGALLTGTGSMWIDHFELLIDGRPFTDAPLKALSAVELDKEFVQGSKVTFGELSSKIIKDMTEVGMLWGFLKYYHPAVASGNYNWDFELFRILPKILNAKTEAEKQREIYQWVQKLGAVSIDRPTEGQTGTVKYKPDLAWINALGYDRELLSKLDSVKRAARPQEHYYVGLVPNVLNPIFKNENPYATMAYPDAGYRLLTLFRYWNMIEYFFPYKSLIGEDWRGVLAEFVPKFIGASNETEFKLATLALIARVNDTHANVYNYDRALDNYFGNNYAAVETGFIENKAVVVNYFNQKLGLKSGLKIGDVIETIDGKTIEQITGEKLPYTPASNYPTQLRNLARDLLRTNDTLLSVGYRRNDVSDKTDVAAYDRKKINFYANHTKRDTCFKLIGPDVAYLYPGTIKGSYLPRIAPDLLKTKGLIIDMRCYPSDFIVYSLSEYLLPKPEPFVKFTAGSLSTPGQFTVGPDLSAGKINPGYYKGRIIIMVNESTLSQSEFSTMAFSTAPNVTIIGSTTAGADGNVSQIVLPSGITTGISGIGVYYPDGRETQRVGIVPDVEIKPTILGIAAGRDELLEKAIGMINSK
ncbi:S41 family peptidase [Salmonirosea aquatica]|uniref:Peptidase S41 n=1 Tax=Salmonirosea aquatica TaxID=2654236 RepID=A0A7C9B7E8_9BACT|nr:peptidase S41 [Cytophagaceae bacterium SJW1-29]